MSNGQTPYGHVLFGLNRIFNSLRDAHVGPGGSVPSGVQGVPNGMFNWVFEDIYVFLQVSVMQSSCDAINDFLLKNTVITPIYQSNGRRLPFQSDLLLTSC